MEFPSRLLLGIEKINFSLGTYCVDLEKLEHEDNEKSSFFAIVSNKFLFIFFLFYINYYVDSLLILERIKQLKNYKK